jgi:lipopolysaccharide/colanic/teichoic acid biosynthesis glycosyltransferase
MTRARTSLGTPAESADGTIPVPDAPVVGLAIKRAVDIVGALTFFLVFGPLYAVVALCVWLGGGRPVHYCQTRLGRRGRPFRFYKFRSMVLDADRVLDEHLARDPAARAEWDTFQKLENDPRILPVGRFIRQLSLDELPQFWNVLKGDMSLVGPRPCMERQRSLYGPAWSHYAAMRPGLTGLWQVSRRNELTFAQRAELDVEYVERWSLWLDCKILVRTVRAVIFDGE